jgi:DNA polymerase-3 subunit epsilon
VKLIQEVPALLVGFDTETTGLSTSEDEAISYGFAVYRSGVLEELSQFFAVPARPMSSGAQRVHGISMSSLQKKLEDGDAFGASYAAELAATKLSQFASDGGVFVGSNPMFDFNMLESTLRRHGHGGLRPFGIAPPQISIIDVVSHDVLIEPRSASRPRRGLAQLCGHYGITPGQHDAAEDARAAAEVLLAQIRRNSELESLDQSEKDIEVQHDIVSRSSRDQRAVNATILSRLLRARRP